MEFQEMAKTVTQGRPVSLAVLYPSLVAKNAFLEFLQPRAPLYTAPIDLPFLHQLVAVVTDRTTPPSRQADALEALRCVAWTAGAVRDPLVIYHAQEMAKDLARLSGLPRSLQRVCLRPLQEPDARIAVPEHCFQRNQSGMSIQVNYTRLSPSGMQMR